MVYVLNQDGVLIMPSENYAKVRVLLKEGKAKVIRRTPFIIQFFNQKWSTFGSKK